MTADERSRDHSVPPGPDTVTVEAFGLPSEALETAERVRGHAHPEHTARPDET